MTKATNRIEITLSDERLAALDEARGNEARAAFIKRWTDKGIAEERKRVSRPCDEYGHRYRVGKPDCVECGEPYDGSATDRLFMTPNQKAALDERLYSNVSAKPAVKPRPKQGQR